MTPSPAETGWNRSPIGRVYRHSLRRFTMKPGRVALGLVAALGTRARAALAHLFLLVGAVQVLDACIDSAEGRWSLVPGITIPGILFLLGAVRAHPGWWSRRG